MARLVLVADGSPTVQKKARGILKGEGFEVETVSNGVAAIKRLGTVQPAVVLADVSMPGRDGYEVCDYVKQSTQLRHIPVLLVASDMEPYDEARGAQVQADGKIKKPFEPQDLISIVAKFAAQSNPLVTPETSPATAPPPAAKQVAEFEITSPEPEELAQGGRTAALSFPPIAEEVAFAEPLMEEAPQNQQAPGPAEPLLPTASSEPEGHSASVLEMPAELAEPLATPRQDGSRALANAIGPVTPWAPPHDPVLAEEQTVPISALPAESSQSNTLLFEAPAEMPEPVWQDETGSPSPRGTAGVVPEVPQAELAFQVASPEVSESPTGIPLTEATSLDSFSLDRPTARQGRFDSVESEVSAPLPESTVEEFPAGLARGKPAAETASEAPQGGFIEGPLTAPSEPRAIPTAESRLEILAYAPTESPSPSLEEIFAESLQENPTGSFAGVVADTPIQGLGEPAAMVGAEAVVDASLNQDVEVRKQPPTETILEPPASIADDLPRDAARQPLAEVSTKAPQPFEATREPSPPSPAAAIDWDLLYLIVHKIVLRMSPPALSREAVEELARRLADETAFELSVKGPPPES